MTSRQARAVATDEGRRAEVVTTDAASLQAAIFDMDGLLVDSEPLWHEAEVEILGALGVPISASGGRSTKGMFVREVTRHWHARHPWTGPSTDDVAEQIADATTALILERGARQPGAAEAIELCRSHGLRLALASSSSHALIAAVLEHIGLSGAFEVVCSAQDEPYGKPHPAVFLTAAARLGVPPERCLVWEDAPAGVVAAKAARMACVAVPEPAERDHPAFVLADAVLGSLEEADESLWRRLTAPD